MADKINFANFAQSELNTDIASTENEITLKDPSIFPDGNFTAVIWSQSSPSPLEDENRELVILNKTTEGVFTASRGVESTSPVSWASGSKVANVVTAETMNNLNANVRKSVSITSANYTVIGDEGDISFVFQQDEKRKEVTLPEIAKVSGRSFKLINTSPNLSQTVRLTTSAGDTINNVSGTSIILSSASAIELTIIDSKWHITNYAPIHSKVKTITSDTTLNMGDGIVYADAVDNEIEINLNDEDGIYGIPLTIVKFDSSPNSVNIDGILGGSISLNSPLDNATIISDIDRNRYIVSSNIKKVAKPLIANTSTVMDGTERFAMITTGNADKQIKLPMPTPNSHTIVTIKKVDDGTGKVIVSDMFGMMIDGQLADEITNHNEFRTYAFYGSGWTRIG